MKKLSEIKLDLQNGVLLETPDRLLPVQKLQASLAHYKEKLKNGKDDRSIADLSKIIASLESKIKVYTKKEESVLSSFQSRELAAVLKALGLKPAPSGPKTWNSPSKKVKELYGISLGSGNWADTFFAVLDNDKKPWGIVDSEGSTWYASVSDATRALKKSLQKSEEIEDEMGDDDETVDKTGETLSLLEDICEMADEMYSTLSEYDELDDQVHSQVLTAYNMIDDMYEFIDDKYDIQIDDDDDDDDSTGKVDENIKKTSSKQLTERVDISRLRQLISIGLVSKEDASKLIAAMNSLENDKPLSVVQRNLVIETFLSLISIVTGDTSILSKVKGSIANA